MSELSPSGGSEGYADCDDEKLMVYFSRGMWYNTLSIYFGVLHESVLFYTAEINTKREQGGGRPALLAKQGQTSGRPTVRLLHA